MTVITHPKQGLRGRVFFVILLLVAKPLLILRPLTDRAISRLREKQQRAELRPDVRGVRRRRMSLAGCSTDLIEPLESAGQGSVAVLYLHGGAFVSCSPATHRLVTGFLARELGLPVYVLDYRQLPGSGVGTSVHDALTAYRELLDAHGFEQIVLAGDSAGGFLCGKVIEYAHANKLTRPVVYLGYSPLLDLDLASNPARSSRRDAYIPKGKMAKLAPMFFRGPIEFTGSRSILEVSPEAFPPTVLITAQHEFLEPDVIELAENLSAIGTPVQVHSYPWAVHAFAVMGPRVPSAAEALSLTVHFARMALAGDNATEQAD